jgi:hypothetical protein
MYKLMRRVRVRSRLARETETCKHKHTLMQQILKYLFHHLIL